MNTEDLLKLKKDLEKIEKEIDQDQGAYNQMLKSLKELGFDNTKDATKEVKRLEELIEEKQHELESDLKIIEKEMEEWDD